MPALCVSLLLVLAFPAAHAAGTLDLRAKFHDFLRAAQQKQWEAEDKWLAAERAFADELRKTERELEGKLADGVASSGEEWRKARHEADQTRHHAEAEIRQKIKIHREQLELELMRFERDRQQELKSFLDSIQSELESFRKDHGGKHPTKEDKALEADIHRAEADAHTAGAELKAQLKRWQDRLKAIKAKISEQ